jgi:hypothetical protein
MQIQPEPVPGQVTQMKDKKGRTSRADGPDKPGQDGKVFRSRIISR